MRHIVGGMLVALLALSPLPNALAFQQNDSLVVIESSGWAVVALDIQLDSVLVSEVTVVPFQIFAEGSADSPVEGATITFTLQNDDRGSTLTVSGKETDSPGHYEVWFAVTSPGRWSWTAVVEDTDSKNPVVTGLPPFRAFAHSGEITETIVNEQPGTIVILNERLVPDPLKVPAGSTVRWINQRDVEVIVDGAGGPFDQFGPVMPGESVSWTYNEPGNYAYVVGPFPYFMRGEIQVTAGNRAHGG